MKNAPFVDWITIRQSHYGQKPLPLFLNGVRSLHSRDGICRFEKPVPESLRGSWDSSLAIQSDGACFLLSGNVGRFGRPDNVFNFQWRDTQKALERICDALAVPRFSTREHARLSGDPGQGVSGSIVSRLDITKNFRTGSDAQARAFIRHAQTLAISRTKRGVSGDESVWWVNTMRMVKVYNKAAELVARHGFDTDDPLVRWCRDNGIVRVECELKRRLLDDKKMTSIEQITDEKLEEIFQEQTAFLNRFDSSDEPDILAAIPSRSRAYAAAWLAGQDLHQFVSRATLFRHARVLRSHGLDILQQRNIQKFPMKVRVIELEHVEAPSWYEWHKKEAA